MTESVSWWKVPIVGVPGFPGCDVLLNCLGLPVAVDEEPVGTCGQNTTWMIGECHVCAEHFPIVAEIAGDTAEAIERAWRERT